MTGVKQAKQSYYLTRVQASNIFMMKTLIAEDRSQLEILYNVSRQLAASLDLHEVLSRVLLLSTSNLAAERASLIVLSPAGIPQDAVILYKGELSSATPQTISAIMGRGLAGWVVRHRQPAILDNTREDNRWLLRPYEQEENSPPKSALCLPLLAQERIVGVLTIVHPRTGYFTADHLKLLQTIADMAGIAIRNAQLYEDVEHNRNLYRRLFAASPDPIFITNLEGKIIDCNHQAVLRSGYTKRELKKLSIIRLDPLAEKALSVYKRKNPARMTSYEALFQVKEGLEIAVEVNAAHIAFRDLDCVQWIFHDISAQRELDKLRDDLTAMLYHDLRSPLANIISSLELLAETLPSDPDPQVNQLLQIAGRSSAHMQRLISSLLDINRLESGQEILRRDRIGLENLVDESIEIVTPLIRSKELEVVRKIPPRLQVLSLDVDMVRRVIINLLENAARFSPLRGRLTIGIMTKPDELIIFVEDQGPGIPEASRERVFEKFVRLNVEGRSRGLGLGLAFCRLAVQAHGGTIWMENINEGGSRFMFSLPVTRQQETTPEG